MRRHFCSPLSTVHLNHLWRVNGQHPVGVDCHTEQPRVGLEEGGKGKRRGGEKRGGRGERERGREREGEREVEKERGRGGQKGREGGRGEEKEGEKVGEQRGIQIKREDEGMCMCVWYGMEVRICDQSPIHCPER